MQRDSLKSYEAEYAAWENEYSPMEFFEYDGENGENFTKVKSMPNEFVWTAHGTCDGDMVSAGFHFFGSPPSCCWDTYGWYVSKVSSGNMSPQDFESYKTSYYCECECYDEDTEEGSPECEKCDGEGWLTHYFD
jgi:hypothetical protein